MASPAVLPEEDLTPDQYEFCRKKLTEWAELDSSERGDWVDELARDTWLMVNKDYDWTQLGQPDQNDDRYDYDSTWIVS